MVTGRRSRRQQQQQRVTRAAAPGRRPGAGGLDSSCSLPDLINCSDFESDGAGGGRPAAAAAGGRRWRVGSVVDSDDEQEEAAAARLQVGAAVALAQGRCGASTGPVQINV